MGVIRDSVILVYAFGAAVAITSIVVTAFSTRYLDTYPNDTKDEGQRQDVYYSVFYIRILAILTTIFLTCYMAWMYADSRHRVNDKKNRKLFALNKLRLYQMQLAIGAKSAAHRKKLLIAFSVLFIMWLPPALVMCFQGWLYKWKKPDKAATLLHVCSPNSERSSTCARLYETGVTALVENLFIFFAALIMFISGKSSGVEYDLERQKLLDAQEDFRRRWQDADARVGRLQSEVTAAQQAQQAEAARVGTLEADLGNANKTVKDRAKEVKAREADLETANKALAQERDRRAAEEARAQLPGGRSQSGPPGYDASGSRRDGRSRFEGGGSIGSAGNRSWSSGASSAAGGRRYDMPQLYPRRPDRRYDSRWTGRYPGPGRNDRYAPRRGRPWQQRPENPDTLSPDYRYRSPPPRRYASPAPSMVSTGGGAYDFVGYTFRGVSVYEHRPSRRRYALHRGRLIAFPGRVYGTR